MAIRGGVTLAVCVAISCWIGCSQSKAPEPQQSLGEPRATVADCKLNFVQQNLYLTHDNPHYDGYCSIKLDKPYSRSVRLWGWYTPDTASAKKDLREPVDLTPKNARKRDDTPTNKATPNSHPLFCSSKECSGQCPSTYWTNDPSKFQLQSILSVQPRDPDDLCAKLTTQ